MSLLLTLIVGRKRETVRLLALALVVTVTGCSDDAERTGPASSIASTSTTIPAATTIPASTTVTVEPTSTSTEDRLVLDGFTMSPSPAGYVYRDNGTSGTEGQRVRSYSFGSTEPGRTFLVAVHRGPGLAQSFTSERYRLSAQTSTRGRVLYEADVVISRELGWVESDDVIAFVTSRDLGFAELVAIADTIYVDV